jgi:hypothetical protein
MKQKLLCGFILLFAVAAATAQPFGHLTIFSEDGDKFTLVLNGEKINDAPQANLRVEELTQPYYNAKIIFEDGSKQPISKNTLMIADADGVFKDVTYKIKRDKNNASKMKMNFFSMTDVDPGFLPASNVQVIRYGTPAPQPVSNTTVTQSTTTTTGGVNAGVNMNGVGINVSIQDPNMQVTHTQTTTTTSSSSYPITEVVEAAGCANGRCMTPNNFSGALQTIKNQGFDDTKLKTAKQIAGSNCLSAQQVADICRTFGFEESRLDFAKFAYDHCTEQGNYFKVNNVFSFSSSVDELTEYVSSR